MTVKISYFAGAGAQFFDNNGVPLVGGQLFTYLAGSTTPATTYTSVSGLVANTNPVILNAGGRLDNEIWLTEGQTYKFVLKDSANVVIGTYDNIPAVNDSTDVNALLLAYEAAVANQDVASKGDALVGFRQSNPTGVLAGAVGKTVHDKFQEMVSVKDFGAVGDGTTDDTTAIQAALTAVPVSGGRVYFPQGSYKITSRLSTTGKSIAYVGDGPYISEIVCAGVNAGIDFIGDNDGTEYGTKRLIVRDISLKKTYEPVGSESGNVGIYANWTYTGIIAHIDHLFMTNVAVYGATDNAYWERGLVVKDGGGVYLTDVKLSNVGSRGDISKGTEAAFEIRRIDASNCDRFQIVNCYFHRFARGILLNQSAAVQAGSIEGIYIANTEIVGCYRGIDAPTGAHPLSDYVNGFEMTNSHVDFGYIAIQFHRVASSFFSNNFIIQSDNGMTITNGAMMDVTSLVDGLGFVNNHFVKPPAFSSTTQEGLKFPAGTTKARVMCNSFEGLSVAYYCTGAPATIENKILFADDNQFVNCAITNGQYVYVKQQAGQSTVATGATITFPLPFGANPIVVISHEGTNTAVQSLPSSVTPTNFVVTHNAGAPVAVNWIAVATN